MQRLRGKFYFRGNFSMLMADYLREKVTDINCPSHESQNRKLGRKYSHAGVCDFGHTNPSLRTVIAIILCATTADG